MGYRNTIGNPGLALSAVVVALLVAGPAGLMASEFSDNATPEENALTVEGISARIGEDNPRVLYILPWQAPSLPRRPRQELDSRAPALVQPVNPFAMEQHRVFRQTLNPLVLSPGRDSTVTTQ